MWLQLQILRYIFVNGVYIIERIITTRNCALTHIHVILNTQLILLQILFFAYNNLGHHVKYGMTCKNLEAYIFYLFIALKQVTNSITPTKCNILNYLYLKLDFVIYTK